MIFPTSASAGLISVIIPVYNAGCYLDECLQSVCRQTYSPFEVILLDDASTDESPAICKKYAEKDLRFQYHRFEKREGQGCRRNHGLRIANGNIIAFVDSDDVIADDMLETMYQLLCSTESQIAVCRLQITSGFDNIKSMDVEIFDGHDAVIRFCNDPAFGAFSCNKLFRKSSLTETGMYPEGMFYEDIAFIPQVCMNVDKIAITDRSLYYYRQHPDSVVGSRFFAGKLDQIKAYRLLIPAVIKKYPDLSSLIHTKALHGIMSVYHVLIADVEKPDPEIRKEILTAAKEVRKNITFFSTPQKKKNLIFTLALCFPGLYDLFLRILYRKLFRRGR